MEERDVFASHGAKKISHEGVVAAYGKGGAKFDRFDLTLPKGARIIREKHGTFRLETKRFSIRIESDVSFVNADVPWEFLARYLKKKHDVVNSFRCNHRWRCHSRLGGYCLGLEYYRWIDSFQDTLRRSFDFEQFLDDISWEIALTTAIIQDKADRQRLTRKARA